MGITLLLGVLKTLLSGSTITGDFIPDITQYSKKDQKRSGKTVLSRKKATNNDKILWKTRVKEALKYGGTGWASLPGWTFGDDYYVICGPNGPQRNKRK